MEQVKVKCKYCGKETNKGGLATHINYCKLNPNRVKRQSFTIGVSTKGRQPKELKECEFCNKKWMTTLSGYLQHKRYCECNPDRLVHKGTPHTEEWKQRASERAKKQDFGGWHTSRTFEYNGIKLDSSYEVTFAQDLDKNNIKWERPKPLLYKLNEVEHRYYPDFYLPEYDVYVDTKNDYLINRVNPKFGITDVEKINLVMEQNKVKIYILDKNNLMWSSLLL